MPYIQKDFSKNIYDYDDFHDSEIEVKLASPWERIAAHMINCILFLFFCCISSLLYIVQYIFQQESESIDEIAFYIFMLIFLTPFFILQLIMMSKAGQSIGKYLLKIKVIKLDGRNPGFVGTVLIREIMFYTISGIFSYLLIEFYIYLLNVDMLAVLILNPVYGYLIPLFCLVMLFRVDTNRRTLQDYLAKTIVIKV